MIGLDYAHEESITDALIDAAHRSNAAHQSAPKDTRAVADDVSSRDTLPEIPLEDALKTIQRIRDGLPCDEVIDG